MLVKAFFDKVTSTITYIVYDQDTLDCLIIDPVFDYAVNASMLATNSIEELIAFISNHNLKPHFSLETHAHADHISGAYELKKTYPDMKIAIGDQITMVQEVFADLFNLKDLKTDGSQFDKLLSDGEVFKAGSLEIKAISTPGHTPGCSSYLIEDNLFCGDALFMPELGCARCDFPKGSARELFNSIKDKMYTLDDNIKTMTAHDYPVDRDFQYESTIGEQKRSNAMIKAETTLDEFVSKREGRDKTLDAPRLLLPSLQINIEAGKLPKAEDNEIAYLKIPLRF